MTNPDPSQDPTQHSEPQYQNAAWQYQQPPQYQQFQQQPPYPQQGYGVPPMQPEPQRRNTVGLIALIAAIIGFVFACIPGALIVGWILLPIAFILGIVGLFQSRQPKKTSIAAIIISVIGTIVAAVVFIAVVSDAIDDAFTPDTAKVTQDGQEQSGDVGTRENPAKIGDTLTGKEWTVVVNEFTPDATEQVMAENQFNDEPESGQQYALINLTVTYTGEGSDYAEFISVAFVGDDGKTYTPADSNAVAPDALSGELYAGASATGNVDIAIPKDASGAVRVTLGVFDDEAFVAVP
ncbi:DUF4352 domain-containing protein [Gordonia humi]|uniref:DUF4352 domain-containing protein n=1 Tax=Gordonia humi TaxID=686429 RepID=A0A840F029_9ACTN|nr:DUF4352 domain-containing protein [Gordonia humi]MBB4135908.1 hypothetical protein [Gordonia humi]